VWSTRFTQVQKNRRRDATGGIAVSIELIKRFARSYRAVCPKSDVCFGRA
jgi:hypothetical protein